MYTIGYDIGSSSIKASLVASDSGEVICIVKVPDTEMPIISTQSNWAEQKPEDWWNYVCQATQKILQYTKIESKEITAIGISYQMHGLVLVDEEGTVLRNAIIWCDSRAVSIGESAYQNIGKKKCDSLLLNSPSNFTASKLRWVKENEPELFDQIYKFMLPGDYIAFKLSGNMSTTATGLSEGIFWNFKEENIAQELLNYYEIPTSIIPKIVQNFTVQSTVTNKASAQCGLATGTLITYRAGDQPNNALSLSVFEPGEIAATAGTSGVLYAITNQISAKETQRLNSFLHINHTSKKRRIGKLLCINGCGIAYRWLKETLQIDSYQEMNTLAALVPEGSAGLLFLPFGNGAERILYNQNIEARFSNLNFNIHHKGHLCRAVLEGIAFSFVYGMEIMIADGIDAKTIKAGNDNLFQSQIFSEIISALTCSTIEIMKTTGAVGAAKAANLRNGFDIGLFRNEKPVQTVVPEKKHQNIYLPLYTNWKNELEKLIQ
ncbi:carbohydrate kinase [Aquimarina sp. U1-2]|uniref:xylulokinase n=1 Tax=Aquimarina sp. U1-2 TaxID=2823141 RepID=UPI001AECF395|nr:FGGY family carbohydrate kinase [Aquimarina sp. U1-2]MBP2832903.1 carbohydrate kinase [Aquimarina sp. U1-2]